MKKLFIFVILSEDWPSEAKANRSRRIPKFVEAQLPRRGI